jgi:hypothetical protein
MGQSSFLSCATVTVAALSLLYASFPLLGKENLQKTGVNPVLSFTGNHC